MNGYIWIGVNGEIKYHMARAYKDQVNWAKLRLLQVFTNPHTENSQEAGFHPEYLTDAELIAAHKEYMRRVKPRLLKEAHRMYQRRYLARKRQAQAQVREEDCDSDGL